MKLRTKKDGIKCMLKLNQIYEVVSRVLFKIPSYRPQVETKKQMTVFLRNSSTAFGAIADFLFNRCGVRFGCTQV